MAPDCACLWPLPPATLVLSAGEVHVWCADLDQPSLGLPGLQESLDAEELARASRFRFERDRDRFIARRGLLRDLLGRYLVIPARQIRFTYNDFGKPELAVVSPAVLDQEALSFNLSHSAGLALYAFTRKSQVGVDIELVRSDFQHEQVAERFFSINERLALSSLPAQERAQAFFACWTRKEAYIKAHGEGLSLPLDQFDVSLAPGEPARLLAARGGLEGVEQWSLQHLTPALGYVGALAVRGLGWQLLCWQLCETPASTK